MSHQHTHAHLINSAQFQRWLHRLHRQKALLRVLFFVITFAYWELMLHLILFKDWHGLLYPLLMAVFMGAVAGLITTGCRPKTNMILSWIILSVRFMLLMVYLIFWQVFKTAFSFSLIIGGSEGANALTQFNNLVFSAIHKNIWAIILFAIPLIIFLIFCIRNPKFRYLRPAMTMKWATAMILLMLLFTLSVNKANNDSYSPQSLYSNQWVKDLSLRKLGFDLTAFSDFKYALFPSLVPQSDFVAYTMPEISTPSDKMVNIVDVVTAYPNLDSEEASTLYFGDNVRDIDFASLAENEENADYQWLNQYMASASPTTKNEYTGLFKDYNVILITAESFSPWAVDEKLTPTLYKMVHTGFVMNNFYIPAFNNTSDGEYMVCTGLIPNGQGNHSFQDTADNDMALCFGNILGPLSYSTNAYHPHTYTFYERDQTHPNMGYTYKGYGNGLDVTYQWPESDLEMMEKSMDDYINNEHFHAYYMTVSGHMDYTFTDNSMSKKNQALVADMDADEQMKAYVACQIELDRALEYMIQRLEDAGVADKTVIALAPDHYPYAMEELLSNTIGAEAVKWYGLYKSNMILWSASMKEPVQVNKVCSSIDIVPTLCNLLGLNYDSRLYSGQDILSDSPGLMVFANKSFITDYLIYDTVTGETKALTNASLPANYLSTMQNVVDAKWTAAGKILTSDYYRYLKEKLGTDALVTK